jgi:hypothetical protein
MAQLNEQEKRQFQAHGSWVRERCDRKGCRNPIGFLAWKGRTGKVYCSDVCRNAEEGLPARIRRSRQLGVPEDAKHERGAYVEGYDSIEQAILARMAKEPKTKWQTGEVIDELYGRGQGEKAHIRQAIWNLLAQGRIAKEHRMLKICPNGSKTAGLSPRPKPSQRIAETHSNRQQHKTSQVSKTAKLRVRLRDVPTEED